VISFIVPAHDEERLLGATLDALRHAASTLDPSSEIIVVDDASTDATAEVARAHGARVLAVAHRQIAATRNAGAQAAQGDILVFVDADTHVDADVLQAALRALRAGAVGGGAAVRFDGAPPLALRLFVRAVMQVFRWTRIAPGCFIYCRRDAFEAIGGFDQTWYAGEDVAISRALARQGRFEILRESVLTSDRKRHTHGNWEQLKLTLLLLRRGRRVLKSRRHLGLWYDRRG
jgi:glycosyltransferase involved in cell wall biosynthesis